MSNVPDKDNENVSLNLMYGTYSDVLFILFPFLAIALQRLWNGEGIEILKHPDLSVASAIIAGMTVGKFVIGLVSDARIHKYRERIVFFVAVTLFFVLGPSLLLIVKMTGAENVPKFVVFVQPILLIVAVSVYTIAVGVTKLLNESDTDDDEPGEAVSVGGSVPEPLVINPQRLEK